MKKLSALVATVLFVVCNADGQSANDVLYVFKKDWSPAKDINEAAYFMQVVHENDTTFFCRYYQKFGAMVRQECYKDSDLSVPNGMFAWYDLKGRIDSCGNVAELKKDGTWRYFNDSLKEVIANEYDHGKFLETRNWVAKKIYYPDGRAEDMQPAEDKNDSAVKVFKTVQVEASFKDGAAGWQRYLVKNLHVPDRLFDLHKSGTIVVEFDVDTVGNISSPLIAQSLEWSADAEAIRVIKYGPKWIPAIQNGRLVKFRQRQSITFKVD